MSNNILAQPRGDTKPILVPSGHFLPPRLRDPQHVNLPAPERCRLHDYLKAVHVAVNTGDDPTAMYFASMAARIVAEKGISVCDL